MNIIRGFDNRFPFCDVVIAPSRNVSAIIGYLVSYFLQYFLATFYANDPINSIALP